MIYFDWLIITDTNFVPIINKMVYIPKIHDYLEILTDEEVKDFVAINSSDSIKEEENLKEVIKSVYFFLATPDEVQSNSSDYYIRHYNVKTFNLFDPELQLINTKPVIKSIVKWVEKA